MSDCVDDVAFGFADSCPAADFPTEQYEWIFWLSVATAAVFIALAVPRVLYLFRCPAKTRAPAIFLATKLIVGAAFTGLRLGLLVVATRQTGSHSTTRLVASTAVYLVASCVLLALSALEHFKSTRPSTLVCIFLLLALIYDVTRCPSIWATYRRHGSDGGYATFAGLFTAATVVECIFLALESVRRNRWIAWEAADHSPEETSSVLSLGLYAWMNPLLWRGYHEPLTMQHLFVLDRAISVEALDARETRAAPSDGATDASTWHILLWLARPLGGAVLLPVLPRLCLLGFTFCQPFFLQRLLLFLSSGATDQATASGLIAVAVFTYSGIAFSTAIYWYYQERFQSLLRAFLISAVYRKTAHVPHVGDGDPAAVTLMGADVERIYTGLRLVHEVWASAAQVALAAWFLQRQLGLAFLAPLVLVLLGFGISIVLSRRAVPYQSAWMARVQKRTSFTSTVLARIKDLRVSGMIRSAATLVQLEREDEIRVGERSRVVTAISASLSQLPMAVAPALAFAFGPHVLDETRAYTALSFLALLTAPLMVVLQSLPIISACIACLRRIKAFLVKEERRDGRQFELAANVNSRPEKVVAGNEAFIVVRNGTFGWTAENPVLKNLSFCLHKSTITFVVGPVASGKSTLCRALLGEVPHVQGSVALCSDRLGYCDQVPFLFNASIMDNIIGFSPFNAVRYDEVIQATMLAEDLDSLPAGDSTVIGTKGISLSGGQRQRVSLARALYHDADILVLDDIFSGLDGSTQHLVCQSVFGPEGLLRKRGTTGIICTHSTHFLSVADHVIELSSDGIIREAFDQRPAEIEQDEQRAQRAQRVGLAHAPASPPKSNKPDIGTSELDIQGAKASTKTQFPNPSAKPQAAPAPTPPVDFDVYRHWLSTIGPLPLAVFLILVIGNGFFANYPNIWVKLWSADSVLPTPEHTFAYWIGIYALLGAGTVLCVFPAGLIMLRTAVRLAGTDLHHAAVDTVMHSSLRFLGTTDVGKVLNLFSQDMNIMDTQLPRMVNNLSFCLANAIGQAVVIAASSAWLAISYPFFIAMLWFVQRIYLPSSKRLRILDLEAKTPLYTNFLDTLSGLPTIRAFNWFPHQLARNNTLLDDSQRPSYLLAMAQQWLMLTMNVLVLIVAVILVALATQVGSNAGNVGAGLVTLITLGSTLTTIVVAYTGLETSLGAISRLKTFGEETEPEDRKRPGDNVDIIPGKEWPMGGRVQMRRVEASYDGTDKVLKRLTLTIEAGEKVAICGRTGSGKSTILALLVRLIDPLPSSPANDSLILIDDTPLSTVDRTALRERVISASQDAVFLPDGTSFRTNLDPWAAATDSECTTALADLGLAAVLDAKGGLNANLDSADLSAGQKQLFSLARAVLRRRVKLRETGTDGGLLLLDEITSNADVEVEARVKSLLEGEFAAWTVVTVTHRREMAVGCDRVIVMDAGRVVEDGRPAELLEKAGGRFRALWVGGQS
ncbi:ATP-dependent permease MDL1 [Diplogelasinospora grovesii]|uniref:ATP-dependent permease MDL1 n=1 Tax=Diplogelasinospora grovesii TaxID=303347 RepID=A0AAN6N4L5_9PEZI|nr:ATP-dependent permease MDL1 [Diplogelasinospora grovesii]